jgi:hypothetical protein
VSGSASSYPAFPADGFAARWTSWDGEHVEDLTLRWENEAWTATGRVGRERVDYVIRLSPFWHIRQFLLFRDLTEPDLWLGTDGRGRWGEMNGAHRTELSGAHDVALACTPFTHTLPIRRLALAPGDTAELSVLVIDVETLAVVPTTTVYHRIGGHTWRVAAAGATSEFEVDEHGVPTDVPDAFRRVG